MRKNAREEIRVSIDEFKGLQRLNLRVWFVGDDGQMRPGKQSVAMRLEMAGDLVDAFRKVTA
jgi:hypothetical protein